MDKLVLEELEWQLSLGLLNTSAVGCRLKTLF